MVHGHCCVVLFSENFFVLGFKATQNFKVCEATRDAELVRMFNTTDVVIPPIGTATNFTMYSEQNGWWYTIEGVMPDLVTCDLQAELERVNHLI